MTDIETIILLLFILGSPEELKVMTPKKVYTRKQQDSCQKHSPEKDEATDEVCVWNTPTKRTNDIPKCKRLKTLLVKSKKKLNRAMLKNKSLKKIINDKNVVNLSRHKFNSKSSKLVTIMQLRKSKSKKQWSDDEKKITHCI